MPIPISACIICRNEARRITGVLDSLRWCTDIIVVDSGSTDATIETARNHPTKPKVLSHPWLGYNPQRQFAVNQCQHDWVLMLDADEECSPQLAAQIAALTDPSTAHTALFQLPRKNYLAGRYVRCWSPDHQTRLIHKHHITWDPRSLPEIRTPIPPFTASKLTGPILHNRLDPFTPTDLNDLQKMSAYSDLLAHDLNARGKRATFLNLLLRPLSTFLKYYLLKRGFLDGRFGLVIAYKTTIGVMLKYSTLYGMQQLQKNTPPNNLPPKPPPVDTTPRTPIH